MAVLQRTEVPTLINKSERSFVDALASFDDHIKRYDIMLPNAWVTAYHEADLLVLSQIVFYYDRKLPAPILNRLNN
ncbi:hypothetical protein [Psychromonas aquimarina]|uniref:hypothetical protein n=1 Tax=Psychromonas aquimarina TaxID=444919 RepID=UPI00048CEE9F|nr:hypothetical protein [Psychromonas aquimarina]